MNIKQKIASAFCVSLLALATAQGGSTPEEKNWFSKSWESVKNVEYKKYGKQAGEFLIKHGTVENGQFDSNHIIGAIAGATFHSHWLLSLLTVAGAPLVSPLLAKVPYISDFFKQKEDAKLDALFKKVSAKNQTENNSNVKTLLQQMAQEGNTINTAEKLIEALRKINNLPESIEKILEDYERENSYIGRVSRTLAGGVMGYAGATGLNLIASIW